MIAAKTVLVTGSRGFLGKKLVNKLNAKKYIVKEFDFDEGQDIRNKEQIMQAVKGVHVVLHLAAILDENSKELFEVNVNGTRNVCEACEKEKAKLVFLSSVGVYGDFNGTANESSPLNPITPYEKSKLESEKIVLNFQETIEVTVVRSALVLGANNSWKKIISMIRKGFPLIGSGNNSFQLIYVDELVQAIVFLMEKQWESGEIFNVAEKEIHSLKEVIGFFREEIGMKGNIFSIPVFIAMPFAAVYSFIAKLLGKKTFFEPVYIKRLIKNRAYSIAKLESIGWRPMYSTRAAMKETLKGVE
ncbi:MAG: NAD-dependent epimerase/dehydratase family protein [Candidatus Diapherotrites archaeon]